MIKRLEIQRHGHPSSGRNREGLWDWDETMPDFLTRAVTLINHLTTVNGMPLGRIISVIETAGEVVIWCEVTQPPGGTA